MRTNRIFVFVLGLWCCMGLTCLETAPQQAALGKEDETRSRRFLHPLPQECRFKGTAYRVPISSCSMATSDTVAPRERQIVDDFKMRWQKRFGGELKSTGELVLVAGLMKSTPQLQKAAGLGLIDARSLSTRPNAEQAYAIAMVHEAERVTVYLAANKAPGLYYAFLTFEQLLSSHSTEDTVVLPPLQYGTITLTPRCEIH